MDFFTPAQVDALSGQTVRCDLLTRFDFLTETKRVWNGNTDLVSGGFTWTGLQGTGSIDGIGYSGSDASESVTFSLPGIPGDRIDLLALALEETDEADQRLVTVYLQLFDEDWQPVGVPIGIWWGFMQPPKVSRDAITGLDGPIQKITLTAENAFFNRSRPPYGRFTDRDQQKRFPGDKFFQYTASLLFKTFKYPDY